MTEEQAKLDRILSNPDPLLVQSLRRDDKRRRRIVLASLGGLIMLAIITTLAISLFAGGTAATTPDAAKSNALAAEAWQLWQKHELSNALDKFQEAVKLDPNNANAWNGLGWVYFNSGTYDEARNAWEKCLKIEPKHPAALNGLGQLALTRRQYDEAEKQLLAAAENPNATAAFFGLARLYLLQSNWEQAEKWAQKLVASGDGNKDAARMLAAAKARSLDPQLRSQLEPPPARPNVDKGSSTSKPNGNAPAGKVDAARSNALSAQGWQLWQQRNLPDALDKFREAVRLNPNNTNAWNGLGWVCFNSGSGDEAQEAWERCLKLMPNHPAALNGLGQLAFSRHQFDTAEPYLLKAANQNASAAWWGLTKIYLLQGKYPQAEKWAQKIVAQDPNDKDAARMLAAAKARELDPALRSEIEPEPAETPETATPETEHKSPAPTPTAQPGTDAGPRGLLFADSFETGQEAPDGWKQGSPIDGVTYIWEKSVGFDDRASLSMRKTAKRYFPIAEWTHALPYDGQALALSLSAMVKAEKAGKAILDVQFIGAGPDDWQHKWVAYIGAKNPGDAPVTHDWKKYSGQVQIPKGTRQIVIGLQMYGPGQVWFDDIKVDYANY